MTVGPLDLDELDAGIPAGQGRWRFLLRERSFQSGNRAAARTLGDLSEARSRRLERTLNGGATFTFSVPGDSETALAIREFAHEVIAFRYYEIPGVDPWGPARPMFRGVITQSQDHVSEQTHTVNFTSHDGIGMLGRRLLTRDYRTADYGTPRDQDTIVNELLYLAQATSSSSGVSFGPAANLALSPYRAMPDGTPRSAMSGRLRDRTFPAQKIIGEAINDLANVIDGFDYDTMPSSSSINAADNLRIFYPYQGVLREAYSFTFGSTVSGLSRSVNSAQYANYVRVIGMAESEDVPPPHAEAWNDDATDLVSNPSGLWMSGDSMADVTEIPTLAERAAGLLSLNGLAVPNYSLYLRPGAYYDGAFELGDTVHLMIRRGRLDVDTWVRVIAVNFAIGDDGQEDVEVEVGRPLATFGDLFTAGTRRLNALERR